MPKGGTLHVSTSNVTLYGDGSDWRVGRPCGEYVELRISDGGSGMPAEIVEQIFEPFFTTKREGHGTGLGLASVRELVKKSGGDIRVETKPCAGTTFYVYFPRAISTDSETARLPSADDSDHEQGTGTVLLIEDQEALRETTAEILEHSGYTVIQAADGLSGLKLWRDGIIADIIVTDVIMPELCGTEMIQQMSEIRPLEKTKVLFVSGYSEKKLSAYDFKQDTLHFLEKPYNVEDLLKAVNAVLKS